MQPQAGFRGFIVGLTLACAFSIPGRAQTSPIALTGTLVTPQDVVEHGVVVIQDGRIIASGANVQVPKGAKVVAVDGVIAPGLVDLHNHMTFNVFPRWKPAAEFGARYDWQQKPIYNILITVPHRELVDEGLECTMERYAELKAIAQGETSVTGSARGCSGLGLDRELDVDPRLGPGLGKILYDVFPFQLNEEQMNEARGVLGGTPRGSLLIHVSEGGPHDASAAREFTMLRASGLLRPGVTVIHGVAIPAAGFSDMAKAGVGLVWSPRSNIELYGDTANVAAAKAAGVTMALAPDWSPTGSVGLLAEMNFASVWNQTQSPPVFTERDLVLMATANAARLVALEGQVGSLAPGHAADIIVVRRGLPDAYASLTHAAPEDVELVVIAGRAMFGDPALLQEMDGGAGEPAQVCGTAKAFTATAGLAATSHQLTRALQRVGRNLAPLTECGE